MINEIDKQLFELIETNKLKLVELFKKSFKRYPQETLKYLFFIRDYKHGYGLRDLFRLILLEIINTKYINMGELYNCIKIYGRIDDSFVFLFTKYRKDILNCIKNDLKNEYLYKWLPSINSSSQDTRKKALIIRNHLHMSNKEYRQMLSLNRKKLNLVEINLSSKEYSRIEYKKLPYTSKRKLKLALQRHGIKKENMNKKVERYTINNFKNYYKEVEKIFTGVKEWINY